MEVSENVIVLVVRSQDSSIGYIAAFSGNIGGRSTIEGFVPPIYDLTDPDGKFRKKEEIYGVA
jgi:tRNA pseudouridine32 synthase/23S rRNA pseudouridine746 synthase